MMRFVISLLALLAAVPTHAQGAFDVWDRFVEECTSALDAPFKGVLTGLVNPDGGEATIFAEDGQLFVGVRPLSDIAMKDVALATITVGGETYETHTVSYCTMIMVLEDPTIYLGFFEIAKARAAELVGDTQMQIGGKLLASPTFLGAAGDYTAYAATFTTPGPFPRPISVRVQEVPRNVTLTLTKITEIEGN